MIEPRLLKGTRDFLPEDMRKRKYILSIIREIFEKHGFEEIETPAIEYWDILAGKYGEEEKLIYKFKDRGEREVGLRYDFTVPLSRVIAMHPEIPMPFRRYQIQPVWRADKPQKGRFREFYQCDIDIVGTSSMLADAELIYITNEIFEKLGFKNFRTIINNRKILSTICKHSGVTPEKEMEVCISIDKIEKVGKEGVKDELKQRGIEKECIEKLFFFLDKDFSYLEKEFAGIYAGGISASSGGDSGIQELKKLFSYLKELGISETRFAFSLWLARGLDYYTGPIFEVIVEKPKIGSIAAGGRFDKLIGELTRPPKIRSGEANLCDGQVGKEFPATGISIGLERVVTVMEELNMFPSLPTLSKVLVAQFDENCIKYASEISKELRNSGIETEIYPDFVKLSKQFKYASKKGIPFVIVIGPDEIKENKITIKNMGTGEQKTLPRKELISWLKTLKYHSEPSE